MIVEADRGGRDKDIEWDDVDEMVLKEEVREYGTIRRQLDESRGKTFGKMKAMCSNALINVLEARDDWADVSERHDPNELSDLIRDAAQLHGSKASGCKLGRLNH